ncbi:radical SAM family heme chaperone HemW [Candidatus Hydrogenedentota bacterium]
MGIYLHIPFCRTKCPYCDFFSVVSEESSISEYVNALKSEIDLRRGALPGPFGSVYIGGGTPSILPVDAIATLLEAVTSTFPLNPDAEITVELNPGDVTEELAQGLLQNGVNRISLGIQSFDDRALEVLGRRHDAGEARRAVDVLSRASFENISIDLIFGVPGRRVSDWHSDLDELLDLEPEHVSCYTLTVERGTPLEKMIETGDLPNVDDDLQADMFEAAHARLSEAGYEHYEISNYAKPGKRSRHNMKYWRNERYLGFGAVAFSYVDNLRSGNLASVSRYMSTLRDGNLPIDQAVTDMIGPFAEMGETVIQSLRTSDGLSLEAFKKRFRVNAGDLFGPSLDEGTKLELIEISDDVFKPTLRGMMFWNDLAELFLVPPSASQS